MINSKLTSVKILYHLYKNFKSCTVNTDMTLQKLTNRTINMYLTDEDFKKTIDGYKELADVSGSSL